MMYAYSRDEESYFGPFAAEQEAHQEAAKGLMEGAVYWLGKCVPPPPAEIFWHVGDWLEHVRSQDEYSGDWADGWDDPIWARRTEMEAVIRKAIGDYLDANGLRPTFYNIEEPRKFRVIGKSADGLFEVEEVK